MATFKCGVFVFYDTCKSRNTDYIAIVIVSPCGGLAEGHVVLSRQAIERIVFIAADHAAILGYFDDVTHGIITVLQRLSELAVGGKSDGGGETKKPDRRGGLGNNEMFVFFNLMLKTS